MADNVIANSGNGLGPTFATDDDGTAHHPYVKIEWGANNTQTPVAAGASALPIQDGGNAITVDGTVAATQSGTWNIGTVTSISNVVQVGDNSTTLSVDDGAGSLTVDGTVAATQSGTWTVQPGNTANTTAWLVTGTGGTFPVTDNSGSLTVDNAGTFAVQAAQSGTWNITNVSGTVSLPTGASTSANQTTIIGHLDGVEGLLTTIDADTSALFTAIRAEDAGHTTGDTGIMALAVRNDSDTSLAGTTLDYTPLQVDANGYLKVNIKAGAGSGGTASTDDGAFTAASGSGTPMMGFVTNDSVDSGDVGVVGMLANRQLKVTLYKSDGNEATYAGIADDAAFTVATSVVVPTGFLVDETTPDSADEGDVGIPRMTADRKILTRVVGATDANRMDVDGSGHAQVDIAAVSTTFPVTDNSGSLTVDATTAAPLPVYILDAAGGNSCMDTANDALRVNIVAGAGSGGTAMTDDAAFTPGTTSITPIGAMFDDVTPDSVNEGDAGIVRMSANRNMYVTLRDAAGNERGLNIDASGNLTANITGSVTVTSGALSNIDTSTSTLSSTVKADDAAFTAGTSFVNPTGFFFDDVTPDTVNEGDVGIARMSANRNIYMNIRDAAGNERGANVNASNQLSVSVDNTVTVASHAVTNAGTFAVQVDGNALTALQLIDNSLVAHDAAVSGSSGVNLIGFEARSSEPTAVASADATRGVATLLGKQVVLPFAIPASTWSYASPSAVTDTADDAAKAAGTGSERHYITGVQVFNGHDTVGTEVVIKDGSTVIWRGWAEQTGGGCSAQFNPPLRGTAATAVNVANITTGASTYFNLQGYTAAE